MAGPVLDALRGSHTLSHLSLGLVRTKECFESSDAEPGILLAVGGGMRVWGRGLVSRYEKDFLRRGFSRREP